MSILSSYEKNEEVQTILQYTYDPYRKFGVSSKVCLKHQDKSNLVTDDLVELLDMLVNRDLTGYDAISAVNGFMNHWSDFAHIIKLIIDKNLKTRTDAKLINKVFHNLIPTFDVTLAQKYEDHAHKIN